MCLRLIARSIPSFKSGRDKGQENGNVFLAIFGAIALVGLLGASVMTFMKGPLATSVRLTKMNTAENQMAIGAQVAVMATASQANNGDCDTYDPDGAGPLPAVPDGYVEPIEWRAATTEPHPVNGGLVPLTLGINKKDPWGTEYGYCVWNHGPVTSGAGCGTNMLAGTDAKTYPVVALISAGPDKAFTTTCRTFATADVNTDGDLLDATDLPMVSKAAETDDDVITTFTYEEATGASGGLWNLKTGDPTTAVINKKIEASGVASLQGGVLLPDKSLITCDASTAGVMAKNGTTGIEICDGAGAWTAISGGSGVAGGGLVLTPVTSSAMNVNGTCGNATCYSSNVTFTVTNNLSPAAASAVLVASLSDTANFEFVSNGCNGVSIAAGANCQMVVRAKATGNLSYTGTLNITGNNSPFATLGGTASSFAGCNAGGQTAGGYYLACAVGGYDLITTPGGCGAGATNPTCAGGTDSSTKIAFGGAYDSAIPTTTVITDGALASATILAYTGGIVSNVAVEYCDSLVYGGHSDWFLPSFSQLQNYFYPNRAAVGGFNSAGTYNYVSSSAFNNSPASGVSALTSVGGSSNNYQGTLGLVRCMRWNPTKVVTPATDTTPISYTFTTSYGGPSETRTSNAISIYGVTQPISVSVTGGTGSKFSINGGAYTSTASTATNGDTISVQTTSPLAGQESVVTLTTGSYSTNWQVRTPGNNTIRVFTTHTATYNGNLGGLGGADAKCTAEAASYGLPGNWTAVVTGGYGNIRDRLPWNWKFLKNMNNQTVAVSLEDFMDGISATMNYGPNGVATAASAYWSGTVNVTGASTNSNNCTTFTSSDGAFGGNRADSGGTATNAYIYSGGWANCNGTGRLLCMESNAAGTDLDPDAVNLKPQITFTSGGTGTSNTITVTGVTDVVSVSITPSAGTADIIKNGLSVGATTTTAGLNATLAFTLTAPTTLGTKNTATITIGPDTYSWWVGYADSAREAKAFVTSTTYNPAFGGLSIADTLCNARAAASPFGLSANWKAMLSDSTNNMVDRTPWSWGILKTVTGNIIVDGGRDDLLDGTLDGALNITELGVASVNSYALTGSDANGIRYYPGQTASNYWYHDWTGDNAHSTKGSIGSLSSTWVNGQSSWSQTSKFPLYCIEDADDTVLDTTPSVINIPYAIQVPTSSRQTSSSFNIGGMSTGATTTLSVTATGGTPKFKVNGGAEVASATVANGDTIVLLMDAPATGNSSNKMIITAGGATTLGYWRVWTGDTTGSVVKRVFVTNTLTTGNSTAAGGPSGVDAICQSMAGGAALGGTWKAIVSGDGTDESSWAVNRIGYNWSTLQRIDGQDVVLAGNIWNAATTSLLNPISVSQTGVTVSTGLVKTGTDQYGKAAVQTSLGQCQGWTVSSPTNGNAYVIYDGTSGTTSSSWINNGTFSVTSSSTLACYPAGSTGYSVEYIYCIEQ